MSTNVTGTSRRHFLLFAFLAVSILGSSGCGSDNSDDEAAATTTTSSVATTAKSADALVGKWVATNDCDELIAALNRAGFQEFAAKAAHGVFHSPGKPDPSDPCKGAKPVEHSHSFSESGGFNSYNEHGREVDSGIYEITGKHTFTLSRPPFESEVKFQVEGDTAEFELVVPDCQDKQCQTGALLGIATFFPGTYERVK
jgi:hypothetical protein